MNDVRSYDRRADHRHHRPALYSDKEIKQMLVKARRMGHSLRAGSPLEQLTIKQLDRLVSYEKA